MGNIPVRLYKASYLNNCTYELNSRVSGGSSTANPRRTWRRGPGSAATIWEARQCVVGADLQDRLTTRGKGIEFCVEIEVYSQPKQGVIRNIRGIVRDLQATGAFL